MTADSWTLYIGKAVVVDTDSRMVYLGTLKQISKEFIQLDDVDVHDGNETSTSKERYVMDAKRFGIRPNRRQASVRIQAVVSLSLLEDVVEY